MSQNNKIRIGLWIVDYLRLYVKVVAPVTAQEKIWPDDDGVVRKIDPTREEKILEAIFRCMGVDRDSDNTKTFNGKKIYVKDSVEIATEWNQVIIDLKGGAFRNGDAFAGLVNLMGELDALQAPNELGRIDTCVEYWRKKKVKNADLVLEPFKGLKKDDGYWFDHASVQSRFFPQCYQRETGCQNVYSHFADEKFWAVTYSVTGKINEFKRRLTRIKSNEKARANYSAAIDQFEKQHRKDPEIFKLECRMLGRKECAFLNKLIRHNGYQTAFSFGAAVAEYFYSRHSIIRRDPNDNKSHKRESHSFKKFFLKVLKNKGGRRGKKGN